MAIPRGAASADYAYAIPQGQGDMIVTKTKGMLRDHRELFVDLLVTGGRKCTTTPVIKPGLKVKTQTHPAHLDELVNVAKRVTLCELTLPVHSTAKKTQE